MLDPLDVAGELAGGEAQHHPGGQVAIDVDPRLLHIGPGLFDNPDPVSLGVGADLLGGGLGRGAIAGVLVFALDQLALPAGQLDLIAEFVLGDGALLLHRQGPALEGRLVGLLLQSLEGRRLQGAAKLTGGRDVGDPHIHHFETHVGQARRPHQTGLHAGQERLHPGLQHGVHAELGEILRGELLREPGQQRGDLIHRLTKVQALIEVDAEIDPRGQLDGIDHPPDDQPLDREVLEIL